MLDFSINLIRCEEYGDTRYQIGNNEYSNLHMLHLKHTML